MTKRLIDGEDLKTLVGYQIQMTNLRLYGLARNAVANFDISPAKVTALLLIRDNAGCEQSTLGRALSINRSSAMKLVNWLADRALVERRPGKDLRSNALHLTETGAVELAKMVAAIRKEDDAVTSVLAPDEQAALLRMLAKIRHGNARERVA